MLGCTRKLPRTPTRTFHLISGGINLLRGCSLSTQSQSVLDHHNVRISLIVPPRAPLPCARVAIDHLPWKYQWGLLVFVLLNGNPHSSVKVVGILRRISLSVLSLRLWILYTRPCHVLVYWIVCFVWICQCNGNGLFRRGFDYPHRHDAAVTRVAFLVNGRSGWRKYL